MAAVAPYTPAGQSTQESAPARLNFPAGQATAVPLALPAGHTNPGLHTPLQPAVELNPPTTAPNRPAGQGVHDDCRLLVLNRPSGQGLQGA